jgi:hypothetical protein
MLLQVSSKAFLPYNRLFISLFIVFQLALVPAEAFQMAAIADD